MGDIPVLWKIISVHSCIVPIKAELDQLQEGLKLFNVIDILKSFPIQTKQLFVSGGSISLSLDTMLELFEFDFSVQGSNARETEEATVVHWNEFLTEVDKQLAGK